MLRIPWCVHLGGLALVSALACPSLGTSPAAEDKARAPSVILISFDGTRWDHVPNPERAAFSELAAFPELPAFSDVARHGAAAERLIPVFPTNTFPNHVTLVTGVSPEIHGIVSNVFVDPERGLFRYRDDPSWIEVEPIWSIAARQGVTSASFHWVGSEGVWRNRGGPRYWKPFDGSTPEREKVDQILAWLDLPRERPRLITSWFHGADKPGHANGPDSASVRGALRGQDRALARLLKGLRDRDALAHTTLILVSDHGMAAVEKHVDLGAALGNAQVGARVLGAGGFAILSLAPGASDLKPALAVARRLGLEAHSREQAPASLRLGHPRFGSGVVLAPIGTAIQSSGGSKPAMAGSHGYRPEVTEMGGLFLGLGRGARAGHQLGEVHAVDVAPTVLALLGLSVPQWMEGTPIAEMIPSGVQPAGPAIEGGTR